MKDVNKSQYMLDILKFMHMPVIFICTLMRMYHTVEEGREAPN